MKTTHFLSSLIVFCLAIVTFAQDTPLEESFTATNGITVMFPEGYTASEQANGDAITVIGEDATVTFLFMNSLVLAQIIDSPLDRNLGLADEQIQAGFTFQGNDFSESSSIEYSINNTLAIGRTYTDSNDRNAMFLLFLLDSGDPMVIVATGTQADFEPDVPLLVAMADAVTLETIVSRVPRTEGNLVVIDVASGMQLTFELPEGWGLADIERNPTGTALVGAFADTANTNATIIDLSSNTDPLLFFNIQVARLAELAGHTDFSLEEHIINGTTMDGFPIAFYESAEFIEPATDTTPSVVVALVELEDGHYVYLTAQSSLKSGIEDWSRQAADMANSLALRAAYMPIPENAVKLECRSVAYEVIDEDNPTALVACPSNCLNVGGSIWGSDIYTNDSSVCLAAIHAGVIENAIGGAFTIEWLPGQESYKGSTANGVTTSEYGSWGGSFEVRTLGE